MKNNHPTAANTLLTLDYLTVAGVGAVEFVDIAADAGFAAISLISQGNELVPGPRLAVADPDTKAMVGRLRERGLTVNNIDGLYVTEAMDWEDVARLVAVTEYLGAKRGVAMVFDAERNRAHDTLGRLAEQYAAAGLELAVEPAPLSAVGTLAEAAGLIAGVGRPIGLVADSMHLAQAGDTPDVIFTFRDRIVCAQVADARLGLTADQYGYDAIYERQAPGDGDLPLREFLGALATGTPIGVEIPQTSRAQSGVPHVDRVRELGRRTRALLDAIGRS